MKTFVGKLLKTHRSRFVAHNIPTIAPASGRITFWLRMENTGRSTWHKDPVDGKFTAVACFLNDEVVGTGRPLAATVRPGQTTVIPVTVTLPAIPDRYTLKLDMFTHNVTWFEAQGNKPLLTAIELTPHEKTATEKLNEKSLQQNYWFFSPGSGTHLRGGESVFPIFAESAAGCRLTDIEGRQYLDYLMGWGCALPGYSHPAITEAVASSMYTGGVISLTHRLEMEVTEKLCNMFPSAEAVLFGKNGSDVCTAAVRMARIFTGRKKILLCGYHGWHDWYVQQQDFTHSGVPQPPAPQVIRFPFNDMEALKTLLDRHGPDTAAIMIEPASPSNGAFDFYPDADGSFLTELRGLTDKIGALLIFDEIISGFRYKKGSVQQALNIRPDLTCLGKALAASMPLSALVGRRDIITQTIYRIAYQPTFKSEIHSFAAAKAALEIYESQDVPEAIWNFGEQLRESLNTLFAEMDLPWTMSGVPYRMGVCIKEGDPEKNIMQRTLLVQELAANGLLSFKGFLLPSLAHCHDNILEETLTIFRAALEIVKQAPSKNDLIKTLNIPVVK